MKLILLLALLTSTCLVFSQSDLKHRGGPPSEFPLYVYPTPLSSAEVETNSILQVFFMNGHWTTTLHVDSNTLFQFFYLGAPLLVSVELLDANGKPAPFTSEPSNIPYGDSSASYPTTLYTLLNPTFGTYTLTLTTSAPKSTVSNTPDGYIVTYNDSPTNILSYLTTYDTIINHPVGVTATIFNANTHSFNGVTLPQNLGDTIEQAVLEVHLPDGKEIDVPMRDDGINGDLVANDGLYTATLLAPVAGQYRARSHFIGTHEGTKFERTAEHIFDVVDFELSLTGHAIASGIQKDQLAIDVILNNYPTVGTFVRAYTQVWGYNAKGQQIPICWLSGYTNVASRGSQSFVTLELNLNWVLLASARPPFTLKQLRIEEAYTHVIVAQADAINVQLFIDLYSKLNAMSPVSQITQEMLEGLRPNRTYSPTLSKSLITTHGFCSSANPWQDQSADFSGCSTKYFLAANQAISNLLFAEKLKKFVDENNGGSILGHSQGGSAGLTLLCAYNTGLDERPPSDIRFTVQAVGTPWRGCSGSSWSGLIPGGCSSVTDLTPSGAAKWLATIADPCRKKVSYAYTREKDNKQCNSIVNLILKKPNDGTTEVEYAELPNSDNQITGNPSSGECHTTGMTWPPQYKNSNRNKKYASQGCPA